MENNTNPKVGLVCEAGGPFKQLRMIEKSLEQFDCFYITYDTESTKGVDGYLLPKSHQRYSSDLADRKISIENIIGIRHTPVVFFKIFHILFREKPDVIISTGDLTIAGPSFFIANIIGIRTIFIESIGQFEGPSTAGRVLGPVADRILVQNPDTVEGHVDKAEYLGGIF